jgi:hypothetical protein
VSNDKVRATFGEPEHLRIAVNANGDGPIDEGSLAFDHYVCWCGREGCTAYMRKADRHE